MEEIIKVIVYIVCGIITAAGGFVITYLNKKTRQLEAEKNKTQKEKEQLRTEIKNLHNGFREDVHNRLTSIEQKLEPSKELCINCKEKKK